MRDELNAHLESLLSAHPEEYRRSILYLRDLLGTPEFIKRISEIRQKCGIPKEGSPEVAMFPETLDLLDNKVEELVEEYGFKDPFASYLREILLYGDIDLGWFTTIMDVIDLKEMLGSGKNKRPDQYLLSELKLWVKHKPIAILIDPYSSENDIKKLIQRKYNEISSLQKKYRSAKSKIGRVRIKNDTVKRRDKFIYDHRNSPKKELMGLVADNFPGEILDYTHINKIIKHEERKKGLN